jgi:DNA-binding LacI/PurR family transcriptional regulator
MDDRGPAPRVRTRSQKGTSSADGASQRPNIADIAALAQVSTSAVSYALNGRSGVGEATRARILEIAQSLNWRPSSAARALKVERAGAIGIVNVHDPRFSAISSDFAGEFLMGVQDVLRTRDSLLAMQLVNNETEAVEVYQRRRGERRVDGIILLNPLRTDPRIEWLDQQHLPAVVVGDYRQSATITSCWSDVDESTEQLVEHLVSLGHERIARVGGSPRFAHTQRRSAAFKKALAVRGLIADPRVRRGRTSVDQLLHAVSDPREPLTAIFVEETTTAVQLLDVLQERGIRIPEDVSVLTLDDVPRTTITRPTLTVLHRDVDEYGRRTARTLLRIIDDGVREDVRGSFSVLVPRESTGPARRVTSAS